MHRRPAVGSPFQDAARYAMNSAVIALPERQGLRLDRIRGAYNGLGYVLAVCLLQDLWWTLQAQLPALLQLYTEST